MLPRLLAFPLLVALGILFYISYFVNPEYAIYILPIVIALIALYVLQPQIDWWWYNRNLPDLEPPLQNLLEAKLPYYRNLSSDLKLRFRQRCALYMLANDFIPQGPKFLPEDVKGLIAANVVQLTFGQKDYRLPKFERIVVYTIPFPSPQYPEQLHSSEMFEEDGVLLFTADHLVRGTVDSKHYFNIGLYEYSKVFRLSYPEFAYPRDGLDWPVLEKISGFKLEKIKQYIGLSDIDILSVAMVYFFCFPKKFEEMLPAIAKQLQLILNQNPGLAENPIINSEKIAEVSE